MNKRNMTGHKKVLAEISKTMNAFTELDDFFLKADEDIANDPDDPREGIGRFPGLDRLMFLIPCVIYRLGEDISKSKSEKNQMRSPLEHYLVILAIKPQARISSCGVRAESVGHEAPRKGVYMLPRNAWKGLLRP